MAERTGFEPATPGVTGRYSNQLNYRSVLETEIWWVLQGSNLRPTACKAVALPTELNTRNIRKRELYSRLRRSQQAVLLTNALLVTSSGVMGQGIGQAKNNEGQCKCSVKFRSPIPGEAHYKYR